MRDLRRHNRSALLSALYLTDARSRQELGSATGLSQASVSNVVAELLDEGLVVEAGVVDSDGGRPRTLLPAIETSIQPIRDRLPARYVRR